MVRQFVPYPIPEEAPEPNTLQRLSSGVQGALKTYLQMKQQKELSDRAKQTQLIELAKAKAEYGDEFQIGARVPGLPLTSGPRMVAPEPVTPPPNPYQSLEDPYGPLPGMTAATSGPAAGIPAPATAAPAAPGAGMSIMDLTPERLAEIKKRRGSRGVKEAIDEQNLMTGQQEARAKQKKATFDMEGTLRDDYVRSSQRFQVVSEAAGAIQGMASRPPSAAGDLSLIFSYMKLLDPGSTVREGEFANAQNSAGVPDILRAQYNRIRTGQRLAPAQRDDFIRQTGGLYESWQKKQAAFENEFRGIAERSGVDPRNVTVNLGLSNFSPGDFRGGSAGGSAQVPSPMPAPPAAAKPGMVRVMAPDGSIGSIPEANLQKAIARGYKAAQ